MDKRRSTALRSGAIAAVSAAVVGFSGSVSAITINAPELPALNKGNIEHCDEVVAGLDFLETFECGDELFDAMFNAVDGVGANVGDGGRFTRVPRADLTGPGEWATHVPQRATGPNAAACTGCHRGAEFGGEGDGSGPAEVNVIRDPFATADPGSSSSATRPISSVPARSSGWRRR